jgi:Mn-dependent DtxR family transcriptional regulator
MLSPGDKVNPHPNVVFTELENGEAVLLHMDSRKYFSLNESGATIWKLLEKGKTAGEISQALAEVYEVSPERAAQSVTELVNALAEQDLVNIIRD